MFRARPSDSVRALPRPQTRSRGWPDAVVRLAIALIGLAPVVLRAAGLAPLRFGFSSEAFVNVNESDARASLKIWAQTLGTERGIPVDPVLDIYTGSAAIKAALVAGRVDAVTMMTEEYWALRGSVPLGPFIVGRAHGETTERYLLLVPRDSPATRIADLQGRSLNLVQGARGSLAAVWMETLLLEKNLGPAPAFWGKITRGGKLARIVLPVFFHQVDACIVTREGFRTMAELNPQVGRQLRVLAESEALVPVVFCFRGDVAPLYRDKLLANLSAISDSVAGRQTLTLFQSDRLEQRPITDLDDSCALLDRRQRLVAAARAAGAVPPAEATSPPDGGRTP